MEPFVKSPLPLFSKEGDLVFHFAEVGRDESIAQTFRSGKTWISCLMGWVGEIKKSMSLISYLLSFVLIVGFLSLPNAGAADNRTSGFIAFSPVGKSYRYKDPVFIPNKDFSIFGGVSAEHYTKESIISASIWLQMGTFRYYDEENKLRGADDNEGLLYTTYGHSFFGKQKIYAFGGLGLHIFQIATVKYENGRTAVDNYNRVYDERPSFLMGIKGLVGSRINYEYSFCSSKRVRNEIMIDFRLGGNNAVIPQVEEKKVKHDSNRKRYYLHLGGSFDERSAYNLFFGLKIE